MKNKETVYREIQAKLVAKFPELGRLKFGCEIITYGMNDEEIEAVYLRTDDEDDGEYWVDSWHIQHGIPGWGSQPHINEGSKVKEILGQPVTLQSLLRGFDAKNINWIMNYAGGIWCIFLPDNRVIGIKPKKSIQDQDLETLVAINEII